MRRSRGTSRLEGTGAAPSRWIGARVTMLAIGLTCAASATFAAEPSAVVPESHVVRVTRAFEQVWDELRAAPKTGRPVYAPSAPTPEFTAYASAHAAEGHAPDSVLWRLRSATISYASLAGDSLLRTATVKLARDADSTEPVGAMTDTLSRDDAAAFDRSAPTWITLLPLPSGATSAPVWLSALVAAVTILLGTLLAGRL